jgi:arabinogalactan endo-1,4-beta-galactosidase
MLAGDFIAGVDASHLKFFEDRGVVYRESGEPRDPLELLKRRGVNCVRLRLFTSSTAQAQGDAYNRINNLDYTVPLAARVKQAGLTFLLDFHYSDTWADPGKQAKPSAWTNLSFAGLEQRMLDYNSNCIAAFKAAGAMPDYVQVGNEIIGGLLWPDGRVGGAYENPTQWSQLGRLLKAAIRGIKDAAVGQPPKIMIHIDRGGDWAATQWYFDNLQRQQVEFDLMGQSYYPFWHGGLSALRDCLTRSANRYGKPVVVAETAFPWTNSAEVVGFPATPSGQSQYVIELAKIVKSLPGGLGRGIIWWGTEYQRLNGVGTAGFEYRSFFDTGGNILPAAGALGQLAAAVKLKGNLPVRT